MKKKKGGRSGGEEEKGEREPALLRHRPVQLKAVATPLDHHAAVQPAGEAA
jgi:hypothetical protein